MNIVKNKKIYFIITGVVMSVSIVFIAIFGLKLGIDFTGGSLVEFSCSSCSKVTINDEISKLDIGKYSLRDSQVGYILRTKTLSNEERQALLVNLKKQNAIVDSFSEVGPIIGNELKNKAFWAIMLVLIGIIIFVAVAFRAVVVRTEKTKEGYMRVIRDNHGVSSWIYGVVAVIALMHDIVVPVGIFALLGHYLGAEVGVLFVMALLAILGYSVNDTIVVFDRVREHLKRNAHKKNNNEDFEVTVGKSLSETIVRSVNTSFTTLIVLIALYLWGPIVTRDFALTLIAGVIAGTYSSIFFASPLLIFFKNKINNK